MTDIKDFVHKLIPTEQLPNGDIKGIYAIYGIETNKIYIGSSMNVKTRITTHRSSLRYNNHIVKQLQNDFNKYGEDKFIFGVVEIYNNIPEFILRTKEQQFIDMFDKNILYNQVFNVLSENNIMNSSIEELFNIINFKDDNEIIQDIQRVAHAILINKTKKNPEKIIEYTLKVKNKNETVYKLSNISDYNSSTLINELSRRINLLELENTHHKIRKGDN
jgi:group I intron endonuclease